jgi:DNA-binding GntR family transcriptional regulator
MEIAGGVVKTGSERRTGAEPHPRGAPRRRRGRPRNTSAIGLGDSRPLDRDSPVALYYQLGEILKEKLEAGTWPTGTLFPSEREIEARFGVSRSVVKPALELLAGDGDIVRVRGSGSFVAPPKRRIPASGLLKLLLRGPQELGLVVLLARGQSENRAVAKILEPDEPDSVAQVTVVASQQEPICVIDSFFSVVQVPWMLPLAKALQAGEKHAPADPPRLTRAECSVERSVCGPWTASRLGVKTGDPALVGWVVQWGVLPGEKRERPIELTRLVARGDIAQFLFQV